MLSQEKRRSHMQLFELQDEPTTFSVEYQGFFEQKQQQQQ